MKKNNKTADIMPRNQIQGDTAVCRFSNGSVVGLGNAQHQGKRPYQEDSFGFSDISYEHTSTRGVMAVVADGMGGLSNGKQVSSRVVNELLEWFDNESNICESSLDIKKKIEDINSNICRDFCADGRVTSGSTVVAVMIKNDMLSWVSLGDSRLYLKRDGKFYQISEDHDLLNDMLGMYIDGECQLVQAFSDERRDRLVNCIGKSEQTCYDLNKKIFRLCDGDVIVLCTDGAYNALTSEEFNQLVNSNAMECAGEIRDTVLSKNFSNQDNLTVLVLSYAENQ